MEFIEYHSAEKFADATLPFLETYEIENNMVMSILAQCRSQLYPQAKMYAVVDDFDAPRMAGIMTPPRQMQLSYSHDNEAIRHMADGIVEHDIDIPGFGGHEAISPIFAQQLQARGYGAPTKHLGLTIYTNSLLKHSDHGQGDLSKVTREEADLIFEWLGRMANEIGLSEAERRRDHKNYASTISEIDDGLLYCWRVAGRPVSIAKYTPIGTNGARISGVYTPPEYRGNGYAGACVAALTHELKQQGRWCMLNVDSANEQTNRLYRKLGYRPYCNFVEYSL